jgi:hypothetical protein
LPGKRDFAISVHDIDRIKTVEKIKNFFILETFIVQRYALFLKKIAEYKKTSILLFYFVISKIIHNIAS